MNYEEKYKQALERARDCYRKSIEQGWTCDKEIYEQIFPELKESEDERIRKEIIQFLQLPHPQFVGKRNYEEWITWLEKQRQGAQKSTIDIDKMVADYSDNPEKNNESFGRPLNCMIRAYRQGIYDFLEKQGKTYSWSEEDESMFLMCSDAIAASCAAAYYTTEEMNKMQNWLKSIKPQKHWKPSEQNIKDLEWCADLVKDKMGVGFHRLQVFIDEIKKL